MRGQQKRKRQGRGHPKPIGGVIGAVIKSLGLSDKYNGWMIVTDWPNIVGPAISEHAYAERYDNGVLVIAVPDDSWRQQLSMQSESILRKIRSSRHGKAVTQIRLNRGHKRETTNGNRH